MAQKTMDKRSQKRAERRAKDERNMNRAVILLTGGLIAEWYLLMADRFYAKGGVSSMMAWYDYLGVMRWVGLAVAAVGVGIFAAMKDKPKARAVGGCLAVVGAFFGLTSIAMRHVFPTSVTVLCVAVPVVLILGIIYLFYQGEFAIESTALAMSVGALLLLSRSGTSRVKLCAVLAVVGVALLLGLSLALKKKDGVLEWGGRRVRVISPGADYRLLFGVLALCLVLLAVSLAAAQTAFYSAWALAVAAFVLAVYYTIRLM